MSKLKRNFFYNVCYQLLLIILPLITAPYIARVIGKEGAGDYAYTSAIVSYFCLFILLGLNNYGVKVIAEKAGRQKEDMADTFWNIYAFQFLMCVTVAIGYFLFIFSRADVDVRIYYVQILTVIASGLDITWYYFGREKFKLTTAVNTVCKIAEAVLIFVLVKCKDDLLIYVLIMSVGTLLSQMILWFLAVRELGFRKPKIQRIKSHIVPNLILFIPVLAVSLYKVMDKVMLGGMTDTAQVAVYEYSEKIINIPVSLVNAFGMVMLPFIAAGNLNTESKTAYIKHSLKLSAFASAAMAFGIAAIAPEFTILFYGEQFAECGLITQLLSVTVLTITWELILKTQFFIPENHNECYIMAVLTGAVVNMVANMFMIPQLQAVGATIGTIMAETSVVVVLLVYLLQYVKLNEIVGDCFGYLLSGMIMFYFVRKISGLFQIEIVCLITEVLTGVLIYGICICIFGAVKKCANKGEKQLWR